MITLRGIDARRPCPSDVTDDAWALVAPYLTLLSDAAKQLHLPVDPHAPIKRYLAEHNVDPKPFVRTVTPDAIIAQLDARSV